MLSASPDFLAVIAQRERPRFRLRLKVAWDRTNYIDESARLLTVQYTRNLSEFNDDMLPSSTNDTCSITVANNDYRFSPFHVGGDNSIRAHLSGAIGTYGKPMQLDYGLVIDGDYEYVRLFTGYVTLVSVNDIENHAKLHCDDNGAMILQHKSDSMTVFDKSFDEAIQHVYALGGIQRNFGILDPAPLRIPFVYTDDESPITQCQEIARSTCGFFYHDANGLPCFRLLYQALANKTYFELPTTFAVLEPTETASKLATDIIVGYQLRYPGIPDVLFETETYYTVAPGETKEFHLRMQNPLYEYFPVTADDYVIDNHAGIDMRMNVDLTVTVTGQKIDVSLHNRHTSLSARLIYLRIRGIPLEGGPNDQIEREIVSISGLPSQERVRSIRDEFYIQSYGIANFIAENVAETFGTIPRYYTLRSMQGNPLLDLLDPVTFYDTHQISVRRKGYIVQIATTWAFVDGISEDDIFNQNIVVADVPAALRDNTFFIVGYSPIEGDAITWH